MVKNRTWYLNINANEIASHVIFIGDPARMPVFAEQLEKVQEFQQVREYKTITGFYKDTRVSIVTVGIGAPSAILVLEELWELGVKTVVRAGTGMSLGLKLGDFILVQAATRNEGTSPNYLPLSFPAVPDSDLYQSFYETLEREKASYTSGVIMTSDGFYTEMFHHNIDGLSPQRPTDIKIKTYAQYGIISSDMETSALYIASKYLGIKALTLLLATVDGHEKEKMDDAIRNKKEKELARLTLKGLHHYSVKIEGSDGSFK